MLCKGLHSVHSNHTIVCRVCYTIQILTFRLSFINKKRFFAAKLAVDEEETFHIKDHRPIIDASTGDDISRSDQ